MTFGVERRRPEAVASAFARPHAQSCGEPESSRARVPFIAECQLSFLTVMRAHALQSKWTGSLPAYSTKQITHQCRTLLLSSPESRRGISHQGRRRSRPLSRKHSSRAIRRRVVGAPATGPTYEHLRSTRTDNGCLPHGLCLLGKLQIATDNSTTRRCERHIPQTQRCGSRHHRSVQSNIYSFESSCSTCRTMQTMRPRNIQLGGIQ